MNKDQVHVQVFGLDDEQADLTVLGHCDECGVELWRRTYRPAQFAGMTAAAILEVVKGDVIQDNVRVANHECIIH